MYVYLEAGWRTTVILETDRYGKLIANFEGEGKTENNALLKEFSKQHFRLIDRYFDEHLDSMPLPRLISGYRELLVQNTKPIDSLYRNSLVDKRFHMLGRKNLEAVNLFLGTSRLISRYHLTKDTLRKEQIRAVMHEAAGWIDLNDSDWLRVPLWSTVFTAYTLLKDFSENDTNVKTAICSLEYL